MSELVELPLLTIESAGRREPRFFRGPDGEVLHLSTWGGSPCPGCNEMTSVGEPITKMHGDWWHARCAKTAMASMSAKAAWLVLAAQIADQPRRFKVATIRTVIQQLIHLVESGGAR